ncbi:MAG: sugar phosphate isomerase/epimerase [Ruminococcaceae bacterium]|jgi:sugar phosphate isomerase/epimerase|nr:sugar phosphate isomerase/epimerase [Oscillospiraceae bacterium]
MLYAQSLRQGLSLSFYRKMDREIFREIRRNGIKAVELSFGFDDYMNSIDFPKNWQAYANMAQEEDLELWSIHLPFSARLDISQPDEALRHITLYIHRLLVETAAKAGIKVAVLHPSSEPILDAERPERIRRSREGIIKMQSVCDDNGMKLAIENLPRTCLCNGSAEMIELLQGTGAGIIFDTNHSLIEENVHFLTELVDSGIKIHSLHISDYDFVDERHRLPGDGINNWPALIAQLKRAAYDGPLLYEVSRQPKERKEISIDQLAENMQKLAAGEM